MTTPMVRDASSQLRIIVLGYIVRGPIGGMAWHHLQYVVGLTRLGHEVLFVEDSDDYPSCYDPTTHLVGVDPSYGIKFAQIAFERLGVGKQWGYFDAHRQRWHGPMADLALERCEEADVLVNVSGVNPLRPWLTQIPLRILIDTDPAFTQVRHLTDAAARGRAAEHNVFFSFGELIPTGESDVPDDGFAWQATRQPIVMDAWPIGDDHASGPFTTVMQWDSYSSIDFEGRRYGMKSESFDLICDLPARVKMPLEIALGSSAAPRSELLELGWKLVDPLQVTHDPWTYQDYLRQSRGEFSVAKHGYVASRCGWFSERTACYLASGRPAVVQDTGFGAHISCGKGLRTFQDAASAVDSIEQLEANYRVECRAAREVAHAYFDSESVLASLLECALSKSSFSN